MDYSKKQPFEVFFYERRSDLTRPLQPTGVTTAGTFKHREEIATMTTTTTAATTCRLGIRIIATVELREITTAAAAAAAAVITKNSQTVKTLR